MRLFLCSFLVSLLFSSPLLAQLGGNDSYEFLRLAGTARVVGLGGANITSYDGDLNTFFANPALLHDSCTHHFSLNLAGYAPGITHTAIAYAFSTPTTGTWGVGLQYLDYGEFEQFDPTGRPEGFFRARDFALVIGKSHQIGPFSMGTNIKLVQSGLGGYQSSGLLFDLAGAIIHPTADLVVGMNLRNLGFAFSHYVPGQSFSPPLDVQLGISFKPEKMPVRFSLTTHRLHQWNLVYNDPTQSGQTDAFGNPIDRKVSTGNQLLRHVVLGTELVFNRQFNLRAGYNFLQRRELGLNQVKGASGLSLGLMLRIKRMEVAYSRAFWHLAGGSNMFTITLNTKTLVRKKRVIE